MTTEITSPIKAIRAYCIECSGGNMAEVRECTVKHCELYAFRFGKNPYIKRTMTEEQRAASAERLKKARELKG